MLTGAVVVLHVIVSLMLIMFILLKSGRGGGLSEMFGGGAMSSMAGSTVVEKNLDRLTLFTAAIWLVAIVGTGLLVRIGV